MDISKISGSITKSYTDSATGAVTRSADSSFAEKLENAVRNNDDKELKKACQEFEGIMLGILYKQMKATIIKSDLVEKDAGTEIFESMMDEALIEKASETGSLGLAESLYRQLSRKSAAGAKNDGTKTVQNSEAISDEEGI